MSSPKNDPVRDPTDGPFSGEPGCLKAGCDSSLTALINARIDRVDPSFGLAMDVPGIVVMGHTCYACGRYTPKVRCVYCGWVGDYTGGYPPTPY